MKQLYKYFLVAMIAAIMGFILSYYILNKEYSYQKAWEEDLWEALWQEQINFKNIEYSPEAADCGFDDFFEHDFAEDFIHWHNVTDSIVKVNNL